MYFLAIVIFPIMLSLIKVDVRNEFQNGTHIYTEIGNHKTSCVPLELDRHLQEGAGFPTSQPVLPCVMYTSTTVIMWLSFV